MGFNRESDPWELARELGISIRTVDEVPFEVANTADLALVAWHPDEQVIEARAWSAIARCLLTRASRPQTPGDMAILH